MEGDHHVGQILDALKELEIDDNTLLVFASDNGPQGQTAREMGNQGTPDMGNSGPFRGELGEVTEGSIRTFCQSVGPARSSRHQLPRNVLDHGLFPSFATLIGSKMPTDRPIDGVDQTDVLFGKSKIGNRDSLLSFIGADLVAARWKQWRFYFTDVHPTGIGPQRQPGMFSANAPMAGYPKVYNIQMDSHEDLQLGALFGWTGFTCARSGREIQGNAQEISKPPAPNITQFSVEDDARLMLRWRQRWLLEPVSTALALAHVVEADRLRYGRGGAVRLEHGLRLCKGGHRSFSAHIPYVDGFTLAALVLIWFARLPAEMLGRIAAICQVGGCPIQPHLHWAQGSRRIGRRNRRSARGALHGCPGSAPAGRDGRPAQMDRHCHGVCAWA